MTAPNFQTVEGPKAKTVLFLFDEFIYRKDVKYNEVTMYLKCLRCREGCKSRAKWNMETNQIEHIKEEHKEHMHVPQAVQRFDPSDDIVLEFPVAPKAGKTQHLLIRSTEVAECVFHSLSSSRSC